MKQIVTSGQKYIDIDALACVIAYAELTGAVPVVCGDLNATIPNIVRNMDFKYFSSPPFTADSFIIVDISDPNFLPQFVDMDKVKKVYDHHFGYEKFWGERGQIEKIGAAATQIFELFNNQQPTTKTANLLFVAIMANSLCLKSSVTSLRDVAAIEKLKEFIDLPKDFISEYYSEIERYSLEKLAWTIKNDVKYLPHATFAQLELFDAKDVLARKLELIKIFREYKDCFLNLVSIKDGKSYFITESDGVKQILQNTLQVAFKDNIAEYEKLILRKEIMHFFQ
jgi:nanoRNase/pAp phosphatase (c-di-AMP/oligoRNAs hydrolase)